MRYLAIVALLLTSCSASREIYSQGLHTNSNRAIRTYNDGLEYYNYLDFNKAETLFKIAITYDPDFYEAYMMLGELNTRQKKYKDAVLNYRKAINIDSALYRPVYFSLANSEMMIEDYEAALTHYKTYLRNKGNSEKNIQLSIKNIKNCEFAIEAMKKPVPFNPVNVGNSINTADDEYWPSITADGLTLMFTRQVYNPHQNSFAGGTSQEDFYLSFLMDTVWGNAVNAGEPLNTRQNEGAQTLSSSGNYMFFTACDRPGSLGSCDLYFSAYTEGRWSIPYNLGSPVNSSFWESTPSISADGNMLFFSSNRTGGFGGKDLWYTIMNDKGNWTAPVNAGNRINTEGDEMSPFIHFDGKSLYFASDGRPGMGGLDIYMTRMNMDSTWTDPQNLGYPVNTSSDDMGLVIEAAGQNAYFSSRRDNSKGKDIFSFKLDESTRPNPVSYLKGKVTDRETGKLLKADYELINLSTNRITVNSRTDDYGDFLVCLPSGNNYGINVTKPGYLFYSENFMFEGVHTLMKPLIKKISLSPLKVGEKMLLANVFYEIDRWELKKESMSELENLVELLSTNKDLVVEIGGYTDSTGTDMHNLILSEKRALSVVDYLVSRGIIQERLTYKGYGNNFPIGDNFTSEGRRLNRRTEVKIIGRKK
jgi:OmpA family/WD40-like Beta Propeller Repeat